MLERWRYRGMEMLGWDVAEAVRPGESVSAGLRPGLPERPPLLRQARCATRNPRIQRLIDGPFLAIPLRSRTARLSSRVHTTPTAFDATAKASRASSMYRPLRSSNTPQVLPQLTLTQRGNGRLRDTRSVHARGQRDLEAARRESVRKKKVRPTGGVFVFLSLLIE